MLRSVPVFQQRGVRVPSGADSDGAVLHLQNRAGRDAGIGG